MTTEEQKQKQQEINQHVQNAYEELRKACAIADEYKLNFSWYVAYGMGGDYYGDHDDSDYSDGGWVSSSSQC